MYYAELVCMYRYIHITKIAIQTKQTPFSLYFYIYHNSLEIIYVFNLCRFIKLIYTLYRNKL